MYIDCVDRRSAMPKEMETLWKSTDGYALVDPIIPLLIMALIAVIAALLTR